MLISYKLSQTSIILRVKILDSSVSTGAGKTGLTFNSAGLKIGTIADDEATSTGYKQSDGNIETIATLGTYAAPTAGKCRFKEVDSDLHPGVYELQLANARFAVTDAKSLVVSISGAPNAADCDVTIPLLTVDPYIANGRVKIDSGLSRNRALNNFRFPLVLSSDHKTPAIGLTVTAVRSIDDGAFAPCVNAVIPTDDVYSIDIAASDLDGETIIFEFSATGADTRKITMVTSP